MSAPSLKECYGPPHVMGTKVPHGGSCCNNCLFLAEHPGGPACINRCWVETPEDRGGGGGQSRLPVDDPLEYCCDMWERARLSKVVKRKMGEQLIPR